MGLYEEIINAQNLKVKFEAINKFSWSYANNGYTFTEEPYGAELFLDLPGGKRWGDLMRDLDNQRLTVAERKEMTRAIAIKARDVILDKLRSLRKNNATVMDSSSNGKNNISLFLKPLKFISINLSSEEISEPLGLQTAYDQLFSTGTPGFELIIELPEELDWKTFEVKSLPSLGQTNFIYAIDDFLSPAARSQNLIQELVNDQVRWVKLGYLAFHSWKKDNQKMMRVGDNLKHWVNSKRLSVIVEGVEDIEYRTFLRKKIQEFNLNKEKIYIQGHDVWSYEGNFSYNPSIANKLGDLPGFGAGVKAEKKNLKQTYLKDLGKQIIDDRLSREISQNVY